MIIYSPFDYAYLWLPLLGFVIGFLSSATGGGGGFFFLPVLTLFFKVPAQVAVATSLAATLPVCLAGSVGHYRRGNIDIKIGLIFALAGIAGAMSGAGITSVLNSRQLKNSFGIYSIIIASHMLISNWKKKRALANGEEIAELKGIQRLTRGTFYGFLAGVITATFGTSGTAPVFSGLFQMRLPVKLVLGTSIMIVFVNTFSALTAHFLVGRIDLTLVFFLTAGTIIGALVGTRFLAGINLDKAESGIRVWYAVGMILFGILMLF
ncbi:MAG: sulfite exporter TauE/SafE family protein [Bacteroidales bacterium]|nr:sulfite exporter TauE/SafE family protein [Bacteroidales bacterium]